MIISSVALAVQGGKIKILKLILSRTKSIRAASEKAAQWQQ